MAQTFRIFISSPSDVFAERERIERVIHRLNGEFGGGLLEAVRWERAYYTAARTFQDQIPLPSETDLVVCILWKRLGFELPPDYRRADGTTPTGTEYEFEDAMAAARAKGTPDVLVYRKSAPVLLDAEQVETERAQFEALKAFWSRWFRNETGHFTAAYQSFDSTDAFETLAEAHIRLWLARHRIASSGITWPIETHGTPFRGLQAFDMAHAPVFFGRRRVVERALERLTDAAGRGAPFLLILGASGAGKSSVARAGVLPRVTQPGAAPGIDVWRCCVLRPSEGDTPLHALARALYRPGALPELAGGDSPTPADVTGLLAGAPDAAARAVRLALTRGTAAIAAREGFDRPVAARLLLLVDQFEEALQPPAQRDGFAAALAALVATGVVWVVATLRSDRYAAFQASAGLMALRDGGAQLDLLPPSGAELGETVTGPAQAAGLRFDRRPDGTGLEEELVAAGSQPGALPLLQLVLDALFEARDPADTLLTCAAYDASGGLSGVVERRAEATLAGLDEAAAASLPVVLRALVEVTDDGVITSRSAAVPVNADLRRLVDAFVQARLLVIGDPGEAARIRVAHDALLAGWPRAAALIEADREMLRIRTRVEAAARRWSAEGQAADYTLPPGRPLLEALELLARLPDSLDAATTGFIAASRAADDARVAAAQAHAERELRLAAEAQQARADAATRVARRTRIAAALVSLLLLLAVGAAVNATTQRNAARRQTAVAERNFTAALEGAASLITAVDAHLSDGGMTRRVARELLATADTGIGSLLPRNGDAALSPPLMDADSRLQSSFSRVLIAVCSGAQARLRAQRAVTVAEAAFAQAPSDARALAVMNAEDELGHAVSAEGDWPGARAIYERAQARAEGHTSEIWQAPLHQVRRDLAYTMADGPDRARAVALVRDDLAWQQTRLATRPDDPEILGEQASDYRQLAIAARADKDVASVQDAVDREAALLQRLATLQPDNVNWGRLLAFNARAKSILRAGAGDRAGAIAMARAASSGAASLLAHDPENALWRITALSMDIRLAILLMQGGDFAGARSTLRPDIAAVKALADQGASVLCRSEAAQIQASIGNVMVLLGDGEDGIAALEANLALTRILAGAGPATEAGQDRIVAAEQQLASALMLSQRQDGVIAHATAAIAALQPLLAAAPDDSDRQSTLHALRRLLGDAQLKSGATQPALATFAADQESLQRLIATHPDAPGWRVALAESLLRTAAVQVTAAHPDLQWAALQAAAAAIAPLDGRPDLKQAWDLVRIEVRQAIGTARLVRTEFSAALADYKAALSLAEAVAARAPHDLQARWALSQALAWVGNGYRFNGDSEAAASYAAQSKAAYPGTQPSQ